MLLLKKEEKIPFNKIRLYYLKLNIDYKRRVFIKNMMYLSVLNFVFVFVVCVVNYISFLNTLPHTNRNTKIFQILKLYFLPHFIPAGKLLHFLFL